VRYRIPRVVIAGLRGGSGKTTLSVSLCRAFSKGLGKRVVPFKKGPDYIDAGWLSRASGSQCYNLDTYLLPEEIVYKSFLYHARDADLAIIEGNRGVFDGVDVKGSYSTAELAKRLSCPVVLVIDCKKVTRTVSAMLRGIVDFDPDLKIGGVILNNIAGSRHEKVIRDAIEHYTGLEVLGSIRRLENTEMIERHMGLKPYQEHDNVEELIDALAEQVTSSIDLNRLYEISTATEELVTENSIELYNNEKDGLGLKLGVIRDRAFQFYYPENIEALKARGVEIIEIDATREKDLPDIDAVYIGGGFPETNAIELSRNSSFKSALKGRVEKGLPVYAECGGLMYLGQEIEYKGKRYPMTGILPISFTMLERPAAHGYTVVEVQGETGYYDRGLQFRGHEFHYSVVKGYNQNIEFAFKMSRGKGIVKGYDGVIYKNVLATYTHVHALGVRNWVDGMIRVARGYMSGKVI